MGGPAEPVRSGSRMALGGGRHEPVANWYEAEQRVYAKPSVPAKTPPVARVRASASINVECVHGDGSFVGDWESPESRYGGYAASATVCAAFEARKRENARNARHWGLKDRPERVAWEALGQDSDERVADVDDAEERADTHYALHMYIADRGEDRVKDEGVRRKRPP